MKNLVENNRQPGLDRRHYSRIQFDANVNVVQGTQTYNAELIDISLNGVLISTPDEYQVRTDKSCTLTVTLSADAKIEMQVALVHARSDCLGFQCTSIDMDSIVVLRRLIEINLDDPAASERVLSELVMWQEYAG